MIYAFGYGSLVSRESLAISLGRPVERNTLVPAELTGYRRTWNVATDNRVRLPGYKVYVDDAGRRPDVAIAFLGVEAEAAAAANGALVQVSEDELELLDRRERNYVREEVTEQITRPPHIAAGARIVTYLPRPQARGRALTARAEGRLRTTQAYARLVHAAFEELGVEHLERFERTTEPIDFDVVDLRRQDVP